MSKTNKLIFFIVAIIVIILIVIFSNQSKPKEEEKIKIGIVGHFSGKYASYSIPMKNAMELAKEKIDTNDKIELIFEDDASDVKNAPTAVNKLISIDNVNYIISLQASGFVESISPIVQKNKRILMIGLGSAPNLTKVGDYIFRVIPSDDYQGIEIARFISRIKGKSIAGLFGNNTYSMGIKDAIEKRGNIDFNISEKFESGNSDFKTQLLKIKNSGADVLVLSAYKEEAPIIFKQIKELGLDNLKIVCSETLKDEEILKNSGNTMGGVFVVFPDQNQDLINFSGEYKEKFNEGPASYSAYGYDAFMALFKTIEKAGDSVEKVKSDLLSVSFDGASGKLSLDENRERTGAKYIVYQVKNSQFVPYEK